MQEPIVGSSGCKEIFRGCVAVYNSHLSKAKTLALLDAECADCLATSIGQTRGRLYQKPAGLIGSRIQEYSGAPVLLYYDSFMIHNDTDGALLQCTMCSETLQEDSLGKRPWRPKMAA